jgi:hypothetical protein
MWTRRLAAPDRATHHASSLTNWRDARAPFRYARRFHPVAYTEPMNACAPTVSARRDSPFVGGEPPSSASAVSTACSGLDRPSTACLATRREARPRCVSTDFCFPLLRLRVPVPRPFPASLRSLRFALGRWACTHGQETGGPGVSRRPIRFSGPPRLMHGILPPCTSELSRASDTPVASPFAVAALSHERDFLGPPRTRNQPSREALGQPLCSEVPSVAGWRPRSCASRR